MNTKPRIALIVGSTRPTRFADVPAQWMLKTANARGDMDVELIDLRSLMIDQQGRAVEYVEMLAVPEHLKLRFNMHPEQFRSSTGITPAQKRKR